MKAFFIFFVFFTFSIAVAQGPVRPYFPSELPDSILADNTPVTYGEFAYEKAASDSAAWVQYKAGWSWRKQFALGVTRGIIRAEYGIPFGTSLPDSLKKKAEEMAKKWMTDHSAMTAEVESMFFNLSNGLIILGNTRTQVQQNRRDIHSLAEGFLAQHAKGVKDRGKKKKLTLQKIAEIVSRNRPQRNGQ